MRGGEHKERVKESKYGRCIIYSCMKNRIMKLDEIVLRREERGWGNDGVGESN